MALNIETFPGEHDAFQEFLKEIVCIVPVLGFMLWLSALKFFDRQLIFHAMNKAMKMLASNIFYEKKGIKVFAVNEKIFNAINDIFFKKTGASQVADLTYEGKLYQLPYEMGTFGIHQNKQLGMTLDIRLMHQSTAIKVYKQQ